jgi:hypothetical protein
MMWQSPKARDLLGDDRCVLHSCTSDRLGAEDDVKLYGRARDVRDADVRDAYRSAVRTRNDWEPTKPFHLFAIDVESVGFVVFGEHPYGLAWDSHVGMRRWSQRGE